jgi:hypothetical protein
MFDYLRSEKVDSVGLQETIRQEFSASELRWLEVGGQFNWNWLPATWHSGGLLLGFCDEVFEVGVWRKGTFYLSAHILQRRTKQK